MVNGGLFRKLIIFAIPLIASGILQQSFNAVDVAVVGRFASHQALAAVGSNGPVINLIVNLFIGISVGTNVVIAHYIGQRDTKNIRNAVNTSIVIAATSGIGLLVLGLVIAEPMLRMLDTPDDVIDLAVLYLRIYSLGLPFMMLYNFGAAILRSAGDTKRPFYCLVIAGIINVALNFVLVIGFGMSVDGVAIATVVSNAVSAVIIIRLLMRGQEPLRLVLKDLSIVRPQLRKILQIGVPAGIQGVVFSISNVFILATINSFGSDAAAGSAAALNYESYCYFIISAFAQATVAFTGQNYGAGKTRRCDRILLLSMIASTATSLLLNLIIVWFREPFVSVFTSNPDVIHYAALRVRYVLLFQFIACSYEISGAALRGLGYSMTPMVLTIFGTCLFRLLWVYGIQHTGGSFVALMTVYPVTWTITGAAVCTAYFIIRKRAFAIFATPGAGR